MPSRRRGRSPALAGAAKGSVPSLPIMRESQRRSLGIFLVLFVSYAWFDSGGGWNQNGRFDQVRAVVEQGRLAVDDYLLWNLVTDDTGSPRYRRIVLSDPETRSPRMPRANTLDLSVHDGHYYPNKPPGVTLLALPAYFALHGLERGFGLDPDDWWVQNWNAYLTSVFSVALLSALGGALLFGSLRRLFPDAPEPPLAGAALAYGLGTLVLPYATFLVDHSVVATAELLAFRLVLEARERPDAAGRLLFGAGLAAGVGVVLNNSALLSAAALGVYALAGVRPRLRSAWFAVGGLPPALLLGAYHQAVFGNAFSIPQNHQLEIFQTRTAAVLSVFDWPDWSVLPKILFFPYRGLFFACPVLLLSIYGGLRLWRGGRRPEAALVAGVSALFLALNCSFNAWHGGSGIGPRYLIPALPFLGLALGPAFLRAPRISTIFAAVSVGLMLGTTAIDPQVDVKIRNPWTEYYAPLAAGRTVFVDAYRIRGPVSSRPIGIPGGDVDVQDPDSPYARWNAFNLGEFLFPQSWVSLLPLLALDGLLLGLWVLRSPRGRSPAAPERSRLGAA